MDAKAYNRSVLAAGINYILEGRSRSPIGRKIKASDIIAYAKGNKENAQRCIAEWEQQGILRLLKPLGSCDPDEFCVEMHMFIGQKSPIKGWLNWR
jgi:hypothetical protein